MQQSPDDIFAAHFWAWPDPALKRDRLGRVLFVNAAFLQLFGGRVEDWRGQTVGGWHTPQAGTGPSRFEIRTPATPTMPEQVYDWVELPGADGSAFALARNVTPFVEASSPPPANSQPVDAAPAYDETQAQIDAWSDAAHAAPAQAEPVMAEPVMAEPVIAEPAPVQVAEPAPAPVYEPEIAAAPPVAAPAPAPAAPHMETPVSDVVTIDVPEIDVPQIEAAPRIPTPTAEAPAAEMAAPDAEPAFSPEPAPAAEAERERDFERRALPIENDEAVLGSNWRDAVIAKAVGAVEPEPVTDSITEAAHAANASPDDEPGRAIRILLAEDNAINALLTRTLLEAEGHTVETVEDGQQAVEAMKTSSFDLIFMDMRMPNMDGLESTRKIRTLPNVPSDLPIIALTANAFDDDRNACFDSGMNDFMTKPVSAEELSEMVDRWAINPQQALAS